jgi:hypothetical protein
MRALFEYFGEQDFGCRSCHSIQPNCKISCSYAFFIGVSGVASFLSWKPGWKGDNSEILRTRIAALPISIARFDA